jgi:hypothetical protein
VIRIAQLSDTHFIEDDPDAEGGFAYDTAEGFNAVCADMADRGLLDSQDPAPARLPDLRVQPSGNGEQRTPDGRR